MIKKILLTVTGWFILAVFVGLVVTIVLDVLTILGVLSPRISYYSETINYIVEVVGVFL